MTTRSHRAMDVRCSVFVAMALVAVFVTHGRRAEAQTVPSIDFSNSAPVVATVVVGAAVGGSLTLLGLAADGFVANALAHRVDAPEGWAVYGIVLWSAQTVASTALLIDASMGPSPGLVGGMAAYAIVSSGSLVLSCYGLAHRTHRTARPAGLAFAVRPVPVSTGGAVAPGLALSATF